jgi:alcohol dehydrogenase (cytochrome c)/quinohemoprotein ethanol dehydrogenase
MDEDSWDRPHLAAEEPQNWLTYNGNYSEQRYSALEQIDTGNVAELGLAWSYDLGTRRGQEATPLVVDGTMFVTAAWGKVVALDAASGAEKWVFTPEIRGEAGLAACCDVVNRGAAYDDGRVFVGTTDGQLIALDAEKGTKLWSVQTTDVSQPYTITGAPRVARGKIFIGNGGADYGARGYVSAYDQASGELVWRFYTVPGEPGKPDSAASDDILEKVRDTWSGVAYWQIGGGGTVWDSIVYDPELEQLYIGVGNGGPWNREVRSEDKGDNLFIASVVALDPDTGEYLWHYQETPGDTWDFTSTQQIMLANHKIDGKIRKVIYHAPKNGFFYIIDRADGKLLSAEKFAPVNWAERIDMETGRPIENPQARFPTGAFFANSGGAGAHNWNPMAFSPQTGLVYIPSQLIPMIYMRDKQFEFQPGVWNTGMSTERPEPQSDADRAVLQQRPSGKLIAWDPLKQAPAWTIDHATISNGGVLATAGGLVFQALEDETFRAFAAADGKELWRYPIKAPAEPGAMSYRIDDVQYVAITAGIGGAGALAAPSMTGPKIWAPARVLVFKLGGKAELPETVGTIPALQQVSEGFAPGQIALGQKFYGRYCLVCHGAGTMSAGVLPDLKRSPVMPNADSWRQVVLGGVLKDRGMASFANYLSPDEAEAIRAYVADKTKVMNRDAGSR